MFEDRSILGRLATGLAKWLAVAGALMLMVMVATMVISIGGRALIWLGLRPITGDYELVSIGMGFAVFAFMPWAHLQRGHALVALVTDSFGVRANAWILVITDLLMLAMSTFLAWRLYHGMMDKFAYGETTLLLRIPLGWGYALGLVGAITLALVSVFVLGRSISYAMSGVAEPKRAGGEI